MPSHRISDTAAAVLFLVAGSVIAILLFAGVHGLNV